jgi:uncharacterized protein YdiU (UPF0061 family)
MTATVTSLRPITGLAFDNSYARLGEPFGIRVAPTPLPDPVLVHFNADAARLIDLDPAEAARPDFLRCASGAEPIPGSDPVAMLYAGHQFGSFVPQLGDGRAILLGEVVNGRGERWDLHLKGSGPTPFSRGFDGRSVLRSAIREYLCGEALHALGIPTTRALCVVGSSEPVRRETVETAASIIRMAPTHVRIGSFEVFASRGQVDYLRQLAEHTIALHFPELMGLDDRYARLLENVARRTASLMAQWQAVGFTHGVMNTDNFSITGLTIDYGPYAFMEAFESGFIPNHSDPGGRYAYDQQPAIGQWNVSALAQALLPLMPREQAVAAFDAYVPAWEVACARVMRGKLGLETIQPGDDSLLDQLLTLMQAAHADWSITWRALAGITLAGDTDSRAFASQFADRAGCDAWLARYRTRLRTEHSDDTRRQTRMDAANPKYVLRTWMAHEAITAAEKGDFSVVERLMQTLKAPFAEQPGREAWATVAPAWAGSIELSCSS